jgi:Protein of unknown function (DUF3309)
MTAFRWLLLEFQFHDSPVFDPPGKRRIKMSLGTILLVILILILLGALPTWPHSRSWGYAPSGGLGLIVIILLILVLLGRI